MTGISGEDARWWTYPLRRLWYAFLSPDLPCRYRWCARRRVGLSVWCRQHTDRIMEGEDINGWPLQGGGTAVYIGSNRRAD